MPTYEYICRACGHEFEEFQSIKADPIAVCPKCRKKKVERKIGMGGAVIFKGGGFYETDYRSESYRSGADAEKKSAEGSKSGASGASTTGDADGGASTNAKPDAKTGPTTDAKTGGRAGSTRDGKREAKPQAEAKSEVDPRAESKVKDTATSAAERKAESKAESKADSSAASAENRRIEARATHQSRIGRGIGNIVKKKVAAKKKR